MITKFDDEKFYLGKICKQNHDFQDGYTLRYKSTRQCVQCHSERAKMPEVKIRQKLYQERNSTKIAQRNQKYYLTHKERILQQCKEYRERHKEEKRESDRKYRAENRETILSRQKKYRQENSIAIK